LSAPKNNAVSVLLDTTIFICTDACLGSVEMYADWVLITATNTPSDIPESYASVAEPDVHKN